MNTRLICRRSRMALAVVSILVLSAVPSAMADIGNIDVHGFASQGYMESNEYNYLTPSLKGSWAMSEYAVNIGTNISDDLRIGVQFFARNLGDLGKNKVGVDWAFGDYHKHDWLGIRAGRVKMPYGLYNETADFDHVRTSVLQPQSVYDLRMRDFRTAINGINPYGNLDLQSGGSLEYQAVAGYFSHPENGSQSKFIDEVPLFSFKSSNNEQTVIGQLIWNTPLQGLRVAHTYNTNKSTLTVLWDPMIAAMAGYPPEQVFDSESEIHVSSLEFSYDNFMLAGEYNTWVTKMDGVKQMNWENWYAQGSYRVNHWFEFGSYYSVHYDDKDDRNGENYALDFQAWQKDLALSLRFDISPNMIFKLEGHQIDGVASVFTHDNIQMLTDPSSIEQNWYMVTSKVSFAF